MIQHYRIPSSKVFLASMQKVPYKKIIDPILRRGMLSSFLAQFPFSFEYSSHNLDYVLEVGLSLDVPTCVEFRHINWQDKEKGIGFGNVDLPRLLDLPRPSSIATSDEIGYIIFHGRVGAKLWRKPTESHGRYNYEYSEDELKEWPPTIAL